MRRQDYLRPLLQDRPGRVGRDRLEILTALIGGPSFDPLFRDDIITIPSGHPIYRWECVVSACERTRTGGSDLCTQHQQEWAAQSAQGAGKAAFVASALGLERHVRAQETACRICAKRPAAHGELRICQRHLSRWTYHQQSRGKEADFAQWASLEYPFDGYGNCAATVCPNLAESPLGLCPWHSSRYRRDGSPGAAALPENWWKRFEEHGEPAPVGYADQAAFRRWCATVPAQPWPGQVNLRGLRPLVKAEIQWGLFVHTQRDRPTRRDIGWIRSLVATCRAQDAGSLIDLELSGGAAQQTRAIVKEILHELRLVYFTPDQAREAGFLETEHFGVLFPHRMSHFDLTGIPQRWLRDLTWDYIAGLLRSPGCPRTASPIDGCRRAAVELGAFLELDAPGGGHDPAVLRREHMDRFVADQRHREREALPSLSVRRPGGGASTVTVTTRSIVFNAARKLLRDALESGAAERLALDRGFIIAVPTAGATLGRTARRPFPTRSPARSPTRRTWPSWPPTTTPATAASATSGKRPSSPGAALARSSSSAGNASAATAGWPCSGTTRPRSVTTTRRSASPNGSTTCWQSGSARPWTASPPATATGLPASSARNSRCSLRSTAARTERCR